MLLCVSLRHPMISKDKNATSAAIRQVTWTGAAVNIGLAATKMLVGWTASSQALLADGVHSVSDLITDGAILVGERFWSAEPDPQHPYGHGRIETIISLAIGAALATVSIGIAWRAFVTMQDPHGVLPGWRALVVAVVSIIAKETLYRWTIKVGRSLQCRALIANAWHHRSDAFSSIPVAIAVVGAHAFPGMVFFDHVAAVIVAVMLLKAAWSIAGPCVGELMEARGDVDVEGLLTKLRPLFPDIEEIHRVRSRRVGGELFVDLHMLVDANLSVGTSHDVAEELKQVLMQREPAIHDVTVHVEPSSETLRHTRNRTE